MNINKFIIPTAIFVLGIGILIYATLQDYSRESDLPTPPQPQIPIKDVVDISFDREEYKFGEKINVLVQNNGNTDIYYVPNTCAGDTFKVFYANGTALNSRQVICAMITQPVELKAGESISTALNDYQLEQLKAGEIYYLVFTYSTEGQSETDYMLIKPQEVITRTFSIN
ncbi:MAG: hypothetical protein R3B92_00010 [Patescibacteria group bacterium]|uniref:Uncharacterized protein n=1 Tax=candidate division WWE3 bacterium TaxID=2053526 RepID=A0A955J2F5_UNCKA|nr:hypothetical protein [candidate division WWE3 bacterium]